MHRFLARGTGRKHPAAAQPPPFVSETHPSAQSRPSNLGMLLLVVLVVVAVLLWT